MHTRSYFSYGGFFIGILLFFHAFCYKPGALVKRHHHHKNKKASKEQTKADLYKDNEKEPEKLDQNIESMRSDQSEESGRKSEV